MSKIKFYAVPKAQASGSTTNTSSLPKSQWGLLPDADLTTLYKDGEDYAAALLYVRYDDMLHKAVMCHVKDADAACDIENDVFESVLRSVKNGAYTEAGQLKSYLRLAARRKAYDYAHSAAVRYRISIDFDDTQDEFAVNQAADENHTAAAFDLADDDPEDAQTKEERLALIEQGIQTLSADLRDVFLMRMQDYSFKEISEELGISINTASSRYQYAVKNIRKVCAQAALRA